MSKTILSPDRKFRYVLHRSVPCELRWVKSIIFVMINPSTADETLPDRTIQKCEAIAKIHKCTDLYVVNLFPLRTKDVKEVEKYLGNTPASEYREIDKENWRYFDNVFTSSLDPIIICGWGKYDKIRPTKWQAKEFLKRYGHMKLKCLKINSDGSPKHPLFVRANTELLDYTGQI